MAATEAQKQAAIDAGLAFLALQQQASGAIGSYEIASTAAAVLAFAEEGSTISGGPYQGVVQNALNYILNNAISTPIAVQPAGNPDSNANNIGVKWQIWGNEDLYVTGLAVPAIVKGGTSSSVVAGGSQAGRTYADVVRDAVDLFAFAQNEPAWGRGGWRYTPNYGNSDNSVSQWPVIGFLYSGQWGINPPQWVKDELVNWVNYIQSASGGSGYTQPNEWVNPGKTGGLLLQHQFLGIATADPRVQNALNYLKNMWNTYGSEGVFGDAYMMWAIYKGLEVTIGLDNMTTIIPRLQGGAVIDNPNHGWNWWEDYCEYLVSTQDLASGAWWNGGSWVDWSLATPWYINILAATQVPGPGGEVPEPATMILLGSGLVGLAGYARRRMKK